MPPRLLPDAMPARRYADIAAAAKIFACHYNGATPDAITTPRAYARLLLMPPCCYASGD